MIAALLPLVASVVSAQYDCKVIPPTEALERLGGATTRMPLRLVGPGQKSWDFQIHLQSNPKLSVSVKWPEDPIQIAGNFQAFQTSEGAIAFVALRAPPCMFTKSMCFSTVHLVDESAATANIVITPAALVDADSTHGLSPFVADILGSCTKTGTKQ
jgi:hypothetical protein